MQSSSNLQSGDWTQLSRLIGNGSTQNFNDPYNPNAAAKFYRVSTVPAANEFHLTGAFATALIGALSYSDLQTTFGLTFPQVEATIPAGNDLSFSTRNSRIYSAVIATLSTLAKNISDSFLPSTPPSAAEIAAALAADISDGSLDGIDGGGPVLIGTTGMALPAYTEQDFETALTQVKAEIPGLYNVYFTGAGASAAPLAAPLEESEIAFDPPPASAGSFTPSTPAVWGDFYWGSSDWQ